MNIIDPVVKSFSSIEKTFSTDTYIKFIDLISALCQSAQEDKYLSQKGYGIRKLRCHHKHHFPDWLIFFKGCKGLFEKIGKKAYMVNFIRFLCILEKSFVKKYPMADYYVGDTGHTENVVDLHNYDSYFYNIQSRISFLEIQTEIK